ncbi:alpha-amylase family protein [Limimaricola pyoseonensis]|uniref:Alpha-amylase n=1 Tax=Limimaricola pyoseonensis TaxID=521013 RepID=A0A1G7AU40_9RHOB|nr:alpha-amylase family protein [Limimaricola pyoseonensis]SDE18349.1 maltose alpha-D-glucosyltransferase/ alpha-amylase [Limimaricola pyoseonensis]
MMDLWYKNAVIYCLDVETYMDASGDGVGDFRGLEHRLDHVEGLGATAVWLNPFYPTPNRDNGYDITDFYGVDPRLGNPGDFVAFSRAAADRGLKVIVDLVVNHTSTDHPWFQSARSDPDSPYRDWYVWSEEKPEDITEGIIFPGVQEAVWTFDETAGAWYMHRFYEHQADLNIANSDVRAEILKIMGYWLELGVSGFRIDAVPFLIEYKGLKEEPDRDPHLLLSEMRDFLSWRRAGAIMLAEANIEREKAPEYFGGREFGADERMHLILDFPLNQALWLGFARGQAEPVIRALGTRPEGPPVQAQWATFLRNHDELSLDKLSEAERQEVFDAFGPEEDMQLYGRGLRRRLAPMLGDTDRVALAQSLLFALPGTPVMWYGDEIGMGEDLSQPERDAVRTPMQWADEHRGGFSRADCDPVRPVVEEGPLGFHETSVAAQRGRPGSLLSRVQQMVRTRRACPEIGWGETRVLEGLPAEVLGLESRWRGARVVTLHNFSGEPVTCAPDLGDAHHLVSLLGGPDEAARDPIPPGAEIALPGYGYRWYRVDGERA